MTDGVSPEIIYLFNDKEITEKLYYLEYQKQHLLYGSAIVRTSFDEENKRVLFNIIDFPEIYKDQCFNKDQT